jgi:5'-nucleotidase
VYRDELSLLEHDGARRRYRMYGQAPDHVRDDGTDLAAVAAGRIAVTPLHFDLTDKPGIETLNRFDLARLLAPAAEEVE